MHARVIVWIIVLTATMVLTTNNAFAFGEVFRAEDKFTEYCSDSGKEKITWENADEGWLMVILDPLSLVNSGRIIISIASDQEFDVTLDAPGRFVEYEPDAFAFWAFILLGDLDESASFFTIQGTWWVDPGTSTIQGIKAKYTGMERLDNLCFGTGKFRTVERIR